MCPTLPYLVLKKKNINFERKKKLGKFGSLFCFVLFRFEPQFDSLKPPNIVREIEHISYNSPLFVNLKKKK